MQQHSPQLPYCKRKAAPKPGGGLKNFKWLVKSNVGGEIYLALPEFDARRGIHLIWNPVTDKAYYTDTDLRNIDAMPSSITDHLLWRELLEGYPYYARGRWYCYDRLVKDGEGNMAPAPITARDVRFERVDLVSRVYAHDGKKRFVAEINELTRPESLPGTLVWCSSVPPTPQSLLPNGSPDARLLKVSDLPATTFLVDTTMRQILFWDLVKNQWATVVAHSVTGH